MDHTRNIANSLLANVRFENDDSKILQIVWTDWAQIMLFQSEEDVLEIVQHSLE